MENGGAVANSSRRAADATKITDTLSWHCPLYKNAITDREKWESGKMARKPNNGGVSWFSTFPAAVENAKKQKWKTRAVANARTGFYLRIVAPGRYNSERAFDSRRGAAKEANADT
ncbi:MAG: hypothetical protein IMX05_01365 [Hydrogenibacillus schlegelii]|nr:hypothetical protein [Hydrogenibacillus schlegelii]